MKPSSPIRKAVATLAVLCIALWSSATGLISAEASNVVRMIDGRSGGARGKQMALLQSYLLSNPITVGIDQSDRPDWKSDAIKDGLQVWSDALADSPFVLAKPAEKPMVTVRFVRDISGGGDIQGQIEATRYLHWGNTVGYRIEATLLVKVSTGRRLLREDELTEVVAHELGHLLGLDDVGDCTGLMGPFVPGEPRMKPSRAEVAAVQDYREQLKDAIGRLSQK